MLYAPEPLPTRDSLPESTPSYSGDGYGYQGREGAPEFDRRDYDLLSARIAARDALRAANGNAPLVGDWAAMPDGTFRRFTHRWESGMQLTSHAGDSHGFYLCRDGSCSYSGGLDPEISFDRIKPTGQSRAAHFWFFHHDSTGAHNGIDCTALTAVYKIAAA